MNREQAREIMALASAEDTLKEMQERLSASVEGRNSDHFSLSLIVNPDRDGNGSLIGNDADLPAEWLLIAINGLLERVHAREKEISA